MSVTTTITVLFKTAPDKARIVELEALLSNRTGEPVSQSSAPYGRLVAVEDADRLGDVNDDGSFRWVGTDRMRSSPLLGTHRLQGRLFVIDCLTRFWSTDYREGPLMTYAVILLTLLSHAEVEGVWYHHSNQLCEGGTSKAMTDSSVHALIDDFIRDGSYSFGKPTQYIRTESGLVINI